MTTDIRSRWKARSITLSLIVASVLFSSILFEKGLGVLGYPSSPVRIANPPNLNGSRTNIEFQYRFSTNSQGLRSKEIPLKKPQGTHRLFVVGDSFTEGTGVEANETFSSILERSFVRDGHAVDVINAGLTGTGPDQYARVFFGRGLAYEPDGLMICIYQNDVSNMPERLSPGELHPESWSPDSPVRRSLYWAYPRTYLLLDGLRTAMTRHRSEKQDFVSAVSERARKMKIPDDCITQWKDSLPADLIQAANKGTMNGAILSYGLLHPNYYTDALDIDTPVAERKWRSMVVALNEMVRVARQYGIAVAVVYIPAPHQYDPSVYMDNVQQRTGMVLREDWLKAESEVERRLAAWSSGTQVPFLDLTPAFREEMKQGRRLNWPLDGHWNQQGHIVAAQAIRDWVEQGHVFRFLQ